MRTTLAIDDDVFSAVKDLAAAQRQSVGTILSALARQALAAGAQPARVRNGVPLLTPRTANIAITPELVNQLRDELP
ncbi:MAG: CopG family transcriptional regulator [Rhodoferax ferrireducens]|uniref:CopG family transcriptional regulator n=1 Tax=Rhodoferax ferrireducens TaxID=192843 RepID=A0A1W9KZ73_9BURK|nr:MAG: CopG family transcriptional regulator [Rhodoferax ferrireducens]